MNNNQYSQETINRAVLELLRKGQIVAIWQNGDVVIKRREYASPREIRNCLTPEQFQNVLREENYNLN